jgi:hypothetical protein
MGTGALESGILGLRPCAVAVESTASVCDCAHATFLRSPLDLPDSKQKASRNGPARRYFADSIALTIRAKGISAIQERGYIRARQSNDSLW